MGGVGCAPPPDPPWLCQELKHFCNNLTLINWRTELPHNPQFESIESIPEKLYHWHYPDSDGNNYACSDSWLVPI